MAAQSTRLYVSVGLSILCHPKDIGSNASEEWVRARRKRSESQAHSSTSSYQLPAEGVATWKVCLPSLKLVVKTSVFTDYRFRKEQRLCGHSFCISNLKRITIDIFLIDITTQD